MILWNRHHGADSAVVPSASLIRTLTLAVLVSCFTTLYRNVLAFDVLVR